MINRARVRFIVMALVYLGVSVISGFGVSFGSEVCSCPNAGDPDGSGGLGFGDMTHLINVAILNTPATFDPDCPRAREDVDCDSLVTIADLLLIVDWVFLGASPAPCDPCDCINDPPSCQPQPPTSGQAIIVESKQVTPGQSVVSIGVYIQNDVPIRAISIPLEFREITSGSYLSSFFTATMQARLASSGLAANSNIRYYNDPDTGNACSGPLSNSYGLGSDVPLTPTPPTDAVGVFAWNLFGSCLAVGTDGTPGSGTPSIELLFDVTSTGGTFEIDTCCAMPASHLGLVECATSAFYLPTFTKGVITIGTPAGCTQTTTDP